MAQAQATNAVQQMERAVVEAPARVEAATPSTTTADFIGPVIGKSGFRSPAAFADKVGELVQQFTDQAYPLALRAQQAGKLRGYRDFQVGNAVDRIVADDLRAFLKSEQIAEGPGQLIQINRRLYDPAGSGQFVRPDVRIPNANRILEVTVGNKQIGGRQLQAYLNYSNDYTTVIRPENLAYGGSFSLVR